MRLVPLAIALVILLPTARSESASGPAKPSLSIEACQVTLTEAGRLSRFAASTIYQVETDSAGKVKSWSEIRVLPIVTQSVDLATFKCCVERWILSPRSTYTITLHSGTTSEMLEAWSVAITDAAGLAIRIVLPRGERGCDEPDF